MKFGSVENPENIIFTLPKDHPDTKKTLKKAKNDKPLEIYVGCAKWNKADLKGFYPKGTKDDLPYYASQFNSIEMNATFYRIFPAEQFSKWYDKTPKGFKFFPKINQEISHWKRLKDTNEITQHYLNNVSNLKEKLGTIFLQMHNNFTPKDFNSLVKFIESWPKEISLAIELRHTEWHNNKAISEELYQLFKAKNVSNIIVDTAGRRDLMHMCLTNGTAFIRFVGANHESDYNRLDAWVERLELWKLQGIKEINFFIHQNIEKDSPLLSSYFVQKLNIKMGINIKVPNQGIQKVLF